MSPFFYEPRRELIDRTLAELRQESQDGIRARVLSMHAVASQYSCRGVDWSRHTAEELATMAACVGGRGLAAVFGAQCKLTHRRSGMPDLFLWREQPRLECRLSEVKSPNDRLSEKQIAWLELFASDEARIDAEVCLVKVRN